MEPDLEEYVLRAVTYITTAEPKEEDNGAGGLGRHLGLASTTLLM
jgi:hypothetical protein